MLVVTVHVTTGSGLETKYYQAGSLEEADKYCQARKSGGGFVSTSVREMEPPDEMRINRLPVSPHELLS